MRKMPGKLTFELLIRRFRVRFPGGPPPLTCTNSVPEAFTSAVERWPVYPRSTQPPKSTSRRENELPIPVVFAEGDVAVGVGRLGTVALG